MAIRELNLTEINAVSGGTDEIVVYGTRNDGYRPDHFAQRDFGGGGGGFAANSGSAQSGGGGGNNGNSSETTDMPTQEQVDEVNQNTCRALAVGAAIGGLVAGVGSFAGFIPHPAFQLGGRAAQAIGSVTATGFGAGIVAAGCI